MSVIKCFFYLQLLYVSINCSFSSPKFTTIAIFPISMLWAFSHDYYLPTTPAILIRADIRQSTVFTFYERRHLSFQTSNICLPRNYKDKWMIVLYPRLCIPPPNITSVKNDPSSCTGQSRDSKYDQLFIKHWLFTIYSTMQRGIL